MLALARDRRGGGLIEYLALVGLAALLVAVGARAFGATVRQKADCQAQAVATLSSGQSAGCTESASSSGTPARGNAEPRGGGAQPSAPTGGAFDALRQALSVQPGPGCVGSVCLPGSDQCFVAGTPVLTDQGLRAIETIQHGDRVVARDPTTGATELRRVVRTFVSHGREVAQLDLIAPDGRVETLGVTPDHRFWVEGRGWTTVLELGAGEPAMALAGAAPTFGAAALLPRLATVYNLEVEGLHTYFVGAAAVLAHNECADPKITQTKGTDGNTYTRIEVGQAGGLHINLGHRGGNVDVVVYSPGALRATTKLSFPLSGDYKPRVVKQTDKAVFLSFDGSDQPQVMVHADATEFGDGLAWADRLVPFNDKGHLVLRPLPRGTNTVEIAVVGRGADPTRASWMSPAPPEDFLLEPTWRYEVKEVGNGRIEGWRRVRDRRFVRNGVTNGESSARIVAYMFQEAPVAYARSLPIAGNLVMIAEAASGTELTGRRMGTEERWIHGTIAALFLVVEGAPIAAEASTARQVATIRSATGLTDSEARALIGAARNLNPEERAFLKSVQADIRAGKAVDSTRVRSILEGVQSDATKLARGEALTARTGVPGGASSTPTGPPGPGAAKEAVTARFGKSNPELEKVLRDLIDDEAHRLNVVEALKDPATRGRTLDLIEEMAAGKTIRGGGSLEDFVKANPGKGPLYEPVPRDVNFNAAGESRKTAHVDAMKKGDPAMRAGAKPGEAEMTEVRRYGRYLKDSVEPSVSDELSALARELDAEFGAGSASFSVRTKSADGLIDKVDRMTTGTAGRGARAGYEVGDVIDAVGGRITVENTEQLAVALERVKAKFGTGDGGRILEIENMYASPKPSSPRYRVVPLIVKARDGKATFELQLTTRRASVAADLDHNIGYKPLVPATDAQKQLIQRMQAEAAALEQLESRLRPPFPSKPSGGPRLPANPGAATSGGRPQGDGDETKKPSPPTSRNDRRKAEWEWFHARGVTMGTSDQIFSLMHGHAAWYRSDVAAGKKPTESAQLIQQRLSALALDDQDAIDRVVTTDTKELERKYRDQVAWLSGKDETRGSSDLYKDGDWVVLETERIRLELARRARRGK